MTETGVEGHADLHLIGYAERPVGYEELFHAHFRGLVRLAALLGADDPEDVAQEAFVRLHRRRSLLRDADAALPYLRRTVCNLARSRLRQLRTMRRHRRETPTAAASAEQLVVEDEDHRELVEALGRLPARQREALVLRYWLDLSEQEIAAVMDVALGTVKSHASRGIATLTRMLEEKR